MSRQHGLRLKGWGLAKGRAKKKEWGPVYKMQRIHCVQDHYCGDQSEHTLLVGMFKTGLDQDLLFYLFWGSYKCNIDNIYIYIRI